MTFLYVIAAEKATKVGISASPERRLKLLQTQSPEALRLVEAFKFAGKKIARDMEIRCHRALHEYRLGGSEWFACEPERCVDLARTLHSAVTIDDSCNGDDGSAQSDHANADMAWASAIRACRSRAGLNQEGLAKRLNMNQQDVSKLEKGRRPLRAAEIPVVAKACGMSQQALFDVFKALYET